MIINFNQTNRQPDPTFEGCINQAPVIYGYGSTASTNAYFVYNNRRTDVLYNLHREAIGDKTVAQVSDIVQNGNRIGYIYPSVVPKKKILFMSIGYDYYEYMFNNKYYKVYEVGLGDNQHYYCVYHNDVTVAIIHKPDLTVNFLDRYVIYAENPLDVEALCSFVLYVDTAQYADYNDYSGYSRENEAFITTDQDLNSKFDPEFIPRIISLG